ncbi:hypothetical protein ACJJTC_012752 [Scirpophaga incertulas]
MEPYTGAQRAFCVRAYYENNKSVITARRLYRHEHGLRDLSGVPSANVIRKWIRMFETTGSTISITARGRAVSARSADIVERVRVSVQRNPQQSTPALAARPNKSFEKSRLEKLCLKYQHRDKHQNQLIRINRELNVAMVTVMVVRVNSTEGLTYLARLLILKMLCLLRFRAIHGFQVTRFKSAAPFLHVYVDQYKTPIRDSFHLHHHQAVTVINVDFKPHLQLSQPLT